MLSVLSWALVVKETSQERRADVFRWRFCLLLELELVVDTSAQAMPLCVALPGNRNPKARKLNFRPGWWLPGRVLLKSSARKQHCGKISQITSLLKCGRAIT